MARGLMLSVGLVCLAAFTPAHQVRPDFSGSWTFDRARSAEPWHGRIVIAPILGEDCVIEQDAKALRLAITTGGQKVTAVYNLAGESRNVSPGDIIVTSKASWNGDRLTIGSTSRAIVNGQSVTIDSERVLFIDKDGSLIVERTGTPASEVTPSRSVYRRVQKDGV